jgi:hypothetical protein
MYRADCELATWRMYVRILNHRTRAIMIRGQGQGGVSLFSLEGDHDETLVEPAGHHDDDASDDAFYSFSNLRRGGAGRSRTMKTSRGGFAPPEEDGHNVFMTVKNNKKHLDIQRDHSHQMILHHHHQLHHYQSQQHQEQRDCSSSSSFLTNNNHDDVDHEEEGVFELDL